MLYAQFCDFFCKLIGDSYCAAEDVKLVWLTFKKVFVRSDITISNQEIDVTMDYGDALLAKGQINKEKYEELQGKAKQILKGIEL